MSVVRDFFFQKEGISHLFNHLTTEADVGSEHCWQDKFKGGIILSTILSLQMMAGQTDYDHKIAKI